jgi:hypothetical protein
MTALPGAFSISQYNRLADILYYSDKTIRGGSLGIYLDAACLRIPTPVGALHAALLSARLIAYNSAPIARRMAFARSVSRYGF